MLVKFEEEEKKKTPEVPSEIDLDALSIEAGKLEAEKEKEKYVPTQEELDRLQEELAKLNEKKFGTLVEEPEPKIEIVEEPKDEPVIKRLSYLRRDA